MSEKITVEDQYEKLRMMHSYLKDIMKERVCDIPHFAGEDKKYPHDFQMALDTVNNALYTAEAIADNYISKDYK